MAKDLAFLGPLGSYSELALKQFDKLASGAPKHSLLEVFDSVAAGEVSGGLVPIENKIQGPVTEALDLLLANRGKIHIEASFTASIRHCLGTFAKDIPLEKITELYSHQQPLDQCSRFISDKLKVATKKPVGSTSRAAEMVVEMKSPSAAAIAAEETLLKAGLTVREVNIGNIRDNQTRFVIIRAGAYKSSNPEKLDSGEEYVTSIIVHPGRDRQGLLFELLQIMSVENRVNLLSIHSRPDLVGGFVFHIDLEGHLSEPRMQGCIESLNRYCQQHTADVAEVIVCGSYKRATFRSAPFAAIGIVGANGAMGRFFSKFFAEAGLTVVECDKNTKVTAEEIAKLADVILLSLPMQDAQGVAEKIVPLLKPGQLIVENCSIKQAALPRLVELAPPGVEVLGIHTMFGPDAQSLRDQNVVITKTELSGSKSAAFEDLLYKYGAKLKDASIKEHDKTTSFIQSLVHLSSICMADVMRESFEDKSSLEAFSTPNARRTLDTLERIVSQDPELILDLQLLNPEAKEIRTKFLEKIFQLALELNNGETASFLKAIEATKEYFKKKEK